MNDPNWDTYTWWSINSFSWWILRTFALDFLKFQVGRMERDVKGGHLFLELCSDLKLATGWSYYIMHQLHWAHPTFLAQFRSDMEKEREQKVHERNNESMHSMLPSHSKSLNQNEQGTKPPKWQVPSHSVPVFKEWKGCERRKQTWAPVWTVKPAFSIAYR